MISGWVGQYTCISFSLCLGLFHWCKIFSVGTSPALSVLSFDPFTSGLLAARGWGLKPGSVAEERKIKLIMGIAALLPPLRYTENKCVNGSHPGNHATPNA